ncbi:MspA family porin [Nocardia kruczakiae]|uniref:MspA family porin n=1 Tax=Nocardia kruczakiae TaxID=261477 RepID=UPI0007A3D9D4|nr:MspA family porin [Nocardia kruczakiae]
MRLPLLVATAAVAASVAALVLWSGRAELGHAQQPGGDLSDRGIHLTASVDHIGVNPPGDRTPNYLMTFSHAVQVSGDYSVSVDGGSIASGQAVAGFLLGCGINVAGGVSVGISPNQGLNLSISPSASPPSASVAAPSAATSPTPTAAGTPSPPSLTLTPPSVSVSPPSVSLGPSFGGSLGLSESLSGTLTPGQVTTVSTATATLDGKAAFPYHITFNDAALNISQCASPVSAVPFVTASMSTAHGLAQTTAYGTQFPF